MSFGAILGAAAGLSSLGSALGLGNEFLGSWATNSAKESLNKNITKTNLKVQKEYDLWTQQQDKSYEQWWQNYLYDLQNNQYYDLAKKYATNTASWAVQGLKKAGLNPVLAAIDGNLSSSTGNANPQQSGHSVSGGSVRGASVSGGSNASPVNVAGALSAASAAQQASIDTEIKKETKEPTIEAAKSNASKAASDAELAKQQVVNAGLQPSQIAANTEQSQASAAKLKADAEVAHAQAVKMQVDTINNAKNSGLGGLAGALIRTTREIADATGDSKTPSVADEYRTLLEGTLRRDAPGVSSAPSSAGRWYDVLKYLVPVLGTPMLINDLRNDVWRATPDVRFHDDKEGTRSFRVPVK